MAVQGRSLAQQQFELQLQQSNPRKVKLLRANAYNCTGGLCFQNGRESINALCPVCAGTGYLGVSIATSGPNNGQRIVTATGALFDDTKPPASQTYMIYGDVQTGHGLYGSGGDYLKVIADVGKWPVGDATLFCLMYDRDRSTGKMIYPMVSSTLPRPDRIISTHGLVYNVVRQMIIEIGVEQLCRAFSLEEGNFTATGATGSAR